MTADTLTLRNVEIEGRSGLDLRIEDGVIAEIGAGLAARGDVVDGRGGALMAGLIDHHIHLLALAAQAHSVVLDGARDAAQCVALLKAKLADTASGHWVRATGYHERMVGDLSRADLDAIAPDHPLRVQHQSGILWVLNGRALERVLQGDVPSCVECDAQGKPTGRIWRGDAWLRSRTAASPPPLAPVGRMLAGFGITAVTDTSATTDAQAASLLADAVRTGALSQRLVLMSAGPLEAPPDGAFAVGPVKVLLDEADLPNFEDLTARIARARDWGRNVAVHCVTAGELAFALAGFEAVGGRPGDRIEHAGVAPPDTLPQLVQLGLTVVTQPIFVHERGDRYLADVDAREQADLYRCRTLQEAGVPVAGSSDAPYGSPDPWAGMRAAVLRRTRNGQILGAGERVGHLAALSLFLGDQHRPGAALRPVAVGTTADLCLLHVPLRAAIEQMSADIVRATLIGGHIIHGT